MNSSELPKELTERGAWWQVAGFTLVALSCLAILREFNGTETRAFLYLETGVKDLYWAFAIPLAGLFEGVRKMFEKASDIRSEFREKRIAKAVAKALAKASEKAEARTEAAVEKAAEENLQKGMELGRREYADRVRAARERFGLDLTPEVEEFIFGSNEFGSNENLSS